MLDAYQDMIEKRKDQYIDKILALIDDDGTVTDERVLELHEYLKEYVVLDLTYRKLLDILW